MPLRILGHLFFLLAIVSGVFGQDFINGDLEGEISQAATPSSWQQIPHTDPACWADDAFSASVDIAGTGGPSSPSGILGIPQSGNSFVTGLAFRGPAGILYHEGIMQNVFGFIVDSTYSIHFYQCVVKQMNALDKSGSWQVYVDDVLIGTTSTSSSNLPFNGLNLGWGPRAVEFTATQTNHIIKFLPVDDDTLIGASITDVGAGLRMGIDNIRILSPFDCDLLALELGNDTSICKSDTFHLDVSVAVTGVTYRWENNDTSSSRVLTRSGTYWVELTSPGCTAFDEFTLELEDCATNLELPNVFSPNGDGVNDVFMPMASERIRSIDVIIFDRWGNQVHESNSLNIEWRGKVRNGRDAAEGVYYYILNYQDLNDDTGLIKGNITLIR